MSTSADKLPSIDNPSIVNRPGFRKRTIPWIFAIVVLALIPIVSPSGVTIAVMNQMMIMILFTVAYNMLLGQGGMLSFGHAVYFGLGGYFCIHLINMIADGQWPIPLPFVPIAGGLAGLLFAFIFGSFSTNKAGTVFAMISLGIGEMIAASSLIFVKFSGGEEGVTADRMDPPAFFGYEFGAEIQVYCLIAGWMLFSIWLMYKFSRTPVGRMANAVRDNPERAEFVGYSQRRIRYMSFCASGFFAGIAGALFAINYEIVTEETVNAITSGVVLLQAYIGGVGFFVGPIVGAIIFTLLSTLLSNYTAIWALYVGIVFVATVMYAPAGLTGLVMMHIPIWKSGHLNLLIKPYLAILLPGLVCFIGVVGILELFHFMAESALDESNATLFGVEWAVDTFWPWLFFGILTVGGFMVCRRIAPTVLEAFETASAKAYGLID
ncbi:MAG: branched-chain amino acid ABC transporter permease [Burkholderiaceae bacterium]